MDGCSWTSSGNGSSMMLHNTQHGTCGRTCVMWPSPLAVYPTSRSVLRRGGESNLARPATRRMRKQAARYCALSLLNWNVQFSGICSQCCAPDDKGLSHALSSVAVVNRQTYHSFSGRPWTRKHHQQSQASHGPALQMLWQSGKHSSVRISVDVSPTPCRPCCQRCRHTQRIPSCCSSQ